MRLLSLLICGVCLSATANAKTVPAEVVSRAGAARGSSTLVRLRTAEQLAARAPDVAYETGYTYVAIDLGPRPLEARVESVDVVGLDKHALQVKLIVHVSEQLVLGDPHTSSEPWAVQTPSRPLSAVVRFKGAPFTLDLLIESELRVGGTSLDCMPFQLTRQAYQRLVGLRPAPFRIIQTTRKLYVKARTQRVELAKALLVHNDVELHRVYGSLSKKAQDLVETAYDKARVGATIKDSADRTFSCLRLKPDGKLDPQLGIDCYRDALTVEQARVATLRDALAAVRHLIGADATPQPVTGTAGRVDGLFNGH